ncbi:MAG: peptidylprolyl isomerase [Polyangiaceae bacterium]|nr:peptidylprolyl isomerase [Polyangiaceae bacterium]
MSDKDSKKDDTEEELERDAEGEGDDDEEEEASAEGDDEEDVDEEEDDEEDEDEEEAAQAKEPAPVRGAPPPPPPPRPADQDPTWWAPHAVLGALVLIGVLGFFGAFNSTLGKVLQRPGHGTPAPTSETTSKPATTTAPAATGQPTARPRPPQQQPAGPVYGAKHLVVQWKGATRSRQERSKEEALKRTEEALAKLKGGAKFEDIVGEYSDEPGAKNTGGNLGKFSRQGFDPKFVDAVEKLKVGEQSGVVETAFGYHIIVRTE